MKLVAKIQRKDTDTHRVLRCTFPNTRKWPFMYEGVLTRNLGPRPYAELSFVNNDGERVIVYTKNTRYM